jgi:hypothetical protein
MGAWSRLFCLPELKQARSRRVDPVTGWNTLTIYNRV